MLQKFCIFVKLKVTAAVGRAPSSKNETALNVFGRFEGERSGTEGGRRVKKRDEVAEKKTKMLTNCDCP